MALDEKNFYEQNTVIRLIFNVLVFLGSLLCSYA